MQWDARREVAHWFTLMVLGAVVRLLFRVRVDGVQHLPRSGPVLLAANHISLLDPVVMAVVMSRLGRRARFFARADLWHKPVVGWAFRHSRQIPVHRGQGLVAATREVHAALAAGQVVVVYPEGGVPATGYHPPPRPGIGAVAVVEGVPVIPVALWGMERRPGRRRPPLLRPAAVVFGEPVDVSAPRRRSDDGRFQAAADVIMAAVRALLPRAQRLAGVTPAEGRAAAA